MPFMGRSAMPKHSSRSREAQSYVPGSNSQWFSTTRASRSAQAISDRAGHYELNGVDLEA